MPRTRSIKPEFWSDEKLSLVSRDARLTFIAIWNQSDDYGSVKGHPAWLKNTIYPYDEIKLSEFQKWLLELEKISALLPYQVNGEKYYYIRTFTKHQTINKPSQAKNPPPPLSLLEGYSRATVGLPSETETETETETEEIECANAPSPPFPKCPNKEIIAVYNQILGDVLPPVRPKLWAGSKSEKHLSARWKEDESWQDIEFWKGFFIYIRDKCPFMTGGNGRSWKANLRWIVKSRENMIKILEGAYEHGHGH